ncbi:hypothetical protein WMY93_011342 [Mugilogobius chulae]|uniref:Uncharacterized protein n=1 Tax=Mugilogobius chulae TaxID=88201 RepID=A0AAW0P5K8_9GOBI
MTCHEPEQQDVQGSLQEGPRSPNMLFSRTALYLPTAAEQCTQHDSDLSDLEFSEEESDVSEADSVEEAMFEDGLDSVQDRQDFSDPNWEPDTEVLAEVHVE